MPYQEVSQEPGDRIPTLQELKTIRQNLIQQIAAVQQRLDSKEISPELLTSKNALSHVERLIETRRSRQQHVA